MEREKMGVSVSASHMIFFISACIVATVLVSTIAQSVYSLSSGIRSKQDILVDGMKSDIEIINDPNRMPYDNSSGTLILYVKNIGVMTLEMNLTDVMVDGQLVAYSNVTMAIVGHSAMWDQSKVLQLTVSGVALGPGDHYVKVSVHTGASDDLGFRL